MQEGLGIKSNHTDAVNSHHDAPLIGIWSNKLHFRLWGNSAICRGSRKEQHLSCRLLVLHCPSKGYLLPVQTVVCGTRISSRTLHFSKILLPTVELCYQQLDLVTNCWALLPTVGLKARRCMYSLDNLKAWEIKENKSVPKLTFNSFPLQQKEDIRL